MTTLDLNMLFLFFENVPFKTLRELYIFRFHTYSLGVVHCSTTKLVKLHDNHEKILDPKIVSFSI